MNELNRVLDSLGHHGGFYVDVSTEEVADMLPLPLALSPEVLTPVLHAETHRYPGLDKKGEGAMVLGRVSYAFAKAMAAADLSFNYLPICTPEQAYLKENPGGILMRLAATKSCSTEQDFNAARRIVIEFFTPIIHAIKSLTTLSIAPQWRIVSDSIAVAWLLAGRNLGCEPLARERAIALLNSGEKTVLTSPNTEFIRTEFRETDNEAQAIIHERYWRGRGGCCRVYTAQGYDYCETCIHLKKNNREGKLQHLFEESFTNAARVHG